MIGIVLLLYLVVPVSLGLWFFCLFFSTHNYEGAAIYQPVTPFKLLVSIILPVTMAARGVSKKDLTVSGAVAALIVGFVLTIVNYCFMTAMLTFFLLASKATKFRSKRKNANNSGVIAASARNWVQVICNGGVATQLTLFYYLDAGCAETVIDFENSYITSWWSIAVLAALSCSCGDTFASELGPVLPLSKPFLITSLSPVPKGTNGGVSIAGTVASGLGGLVVGLAYYLSLVICVNSDSIASAPAQWPILIICSISGLLGSFIDSLLGASLQYSGIDKETGFVTEIERPNVTFVSGMSILDNHSVNLLSTFITSLIMPRLALLLWFNIDSFVNVEWINSMTV